MEIRYALEVFGHVYQRNELGDVVLGEYEFGEGFSASRRGIGGAHVVLNLVEVAEIRVGEKDRANMVQVV